MRTAIIALTAFTMVPTPIVTPAFAQAPEAPSAFEEIVEQSKSFMMADPSRAYELANEAEQSAAGEALEIATAQWLQAEALVRMNRIAEAQPIIDAALEAANADAPGSKLVGDLQMTRGMTARAVSDYVTALDSYQAAHDVFAGLNDDRNQARALQQVGSIYADAHEYERALEFNIRAGNAYGGDPSLDLARLNNMANAYRELGRYEDAETGYRAALKIAEQMNSPLLQSRILTNIALVQIAAGQLDAAESTVEAGLALTPDGGALGWEVFLWGTRAKIAYERQDYGRAATLIGRTFSGLDLTTTPQFFRDFHETAHNIYSAMSQPRLALDHLEAFKRLDDEARDVSAQANLALMGAQFDFATQELEIANLRTDALEREVDLSRAQARQRTLIFGGIVFFFLVALAGGGVHYASMRRSRNEIRSANDKLQTTNIALEKASKAKSEFLATTSHEIRTPLNGILGMTQMLMRQAGLADSVRERIELVHGAGETMKAIVDDILDVAKMETGAIDIRPEKFEFTKMLESVAQLWRDSAEKKGIALNLDLSSCPRQIVGDEQRLRQVAFNLLSNAIKFTKSGHVELDVRSQADETGDRLLLIVSDTGCGIPESELEDIFKPFHQVDGGTTRQQGGTGLGLAICHKLAEAMGGSIRVTSVPGQGSQFTLDIPVELASTTGAAGSSDGEAEASYVFADANPLNQSIVEAMWDDATGPLVCVETLDEITSSAAGGHVASIVISSELLADAPGDAMQQLLDLREALPDAHIVVRLQDASAIEPAMLRLSGVDDVQVGAFDAAAAVEALSSHDASVEPETSISTGS